MKRQELAMRDLSEQELLAVAYVELNRLDGTFDVSMHPGSLLVLVGMLQLAHRHPGAHGRAAEAARHFVELARDYFSGSPALLEAIRRGEQEG